MISKYSLLSSQLGQQLGIILFMYAQLPNYAVTWYLQLEESSLKFLFEVFHLQFSPYTRVWANAIK
jgi:hypothetical protein